MFSWINGSMEIKVYVDGCYRSFRGCVVSRDDTELVLNENFERNIHIQLDKIIAVEYRTEDK